MFTVSSEHDETDSERVPSPKLLEVLVCPFTKGPLTYDEVSKLLISQKAHLAFPIRDGVPLMTREAAISLDELPRKA